MSTEDVRRALIAIDEQEVRDRVAAGDHRALEGMDLTDEERELVEEAATNYPEVAGFAFEGYLGGPDTFVFPVGDPSVPTMRKVSGNFKYSDIVLKKG